MLTFSYGQISALYGAVFWPLIRVLALFSTAPIFSHMAVSMRIRVALALAIALVLAPQVQAPPIDGVLTAAGAIALAEDIMVGLVLGFTVRLVFASIELAGELVGLQIGLGFAGFFDPVTSQQQNPVSTFMSLMATLIFLSIDGHLQMLQALAESFRVFPIASGAGALAPDQIARLGGQIFALALSLALPFIAVALMISVLLGILARMAPQLNLFAIGFPLTLTAGLVVLFLFLPYLETPLRIALENGIGMWVR